jgi:hypothetical protein
MNRRHNKHKEVWLVATGNQALAKTGNIVGTGNVFNIADGQLGVIAASNDQAHINDGDFFKCN